MSHEEKSSENHPVVPPKSDGPSKDFSETRSFSTVEEAEDFFVKAKERLLRPDEWHKLAGALSANFVVCNAQGYSQNRDVRTSDLLKIHVPGPAGLVADWVAVEALTYDDFPDEQREVVAMRVRPASSPDTVGDKTTHFFDDAATSSFIIERKQNLVVASYHGRKELPNPEGESVLRTARNVLVALGGLIGFSDMQWKALLKGLLDD
jgi:hypothetical protein